VKTFNPTTANATEQRQQLMASVTQNYSKLLDDATPFLTVGLMRTANLKAAVDSINTELARAKASHQKVEEVLKESTAVLEKVRGVSAETGVAAHSTAFDQQAERHKKAARAWMIATLALGVVAAVFAFLLFQGSLAGSDAIWTGGHAVRSIAFRVVLLSFFTYFIAWSARNYRANRHNEVVNTHRRIALSTFETFAKAAEGDKDTKNAVLIQTTQAIFSAQRSGYWARSPTLDPRAPSWRFCAVQQPRSRSRGGFLLLSEKCVWKEVLFIFSIASVPPCGRGSQGYNEPFSVPGASFAGVAN